ncbi:MAG: M24 family metallopeptidase [Nitrospinota bacterium]
MPGQFMVDFEERVDFGRLRRQRLEKARAALKAHGIDVLVAFDPNSIRYITGTFGNPSPTLAAARYCLLAKDHEPVLFELGGDLERQKACAPWLEGRIRPSVPLSFLPPAMVGEWGKSLKGTLRELGVTADTLALDRLDFRVLGEAQSAGLEVINGGAALWEARRVKLPDEIECIRLSVALADAALEAVRRNLRPGVRECDVQGEVLRELTRQCCWIYGGGGNFASGEHTHPYWRLLFTDRILHAGDLVIIDRVHNHNGYGCDYVRTFVVGDRATDVQKELYRRCYESMWAGIQAVKPGATTADIARQWNEPQDYSQTTLDFGHSVGLSTHEPPFITVASKNHPEKLEPNMVLAIETYVGEGKQGVRLEENLIVTETGYEIISRYPHEPKLMA